MKHKEFSGSKIDRILACPGSHNFVKALNLPDEPSYEADTGTVLHELAFWCLTESYAPKQFIGREFTTDIDNQEVVRFIDKASAENVFTYVNYVHKKLPLKETLVSDYAFECATDLGQFTGEDSGGYVDSWILDDGILEVIDYKSGFNLVEVITQQLKLYGLSLYLELIAKGYKIRAIKLTIVQPNYFAHQDGVIRSITMTPEELQTWGLEVLNPGIQRAKNTEIGKDLVASHTACLHCPAYFHCPALKKEINLTMGQDVTTPLEATQLPNAEVLTVEQRQRILYNAPLIEKWLDKVNEYTESQCLKGLEQPPEGYKVGATLGHRYYKLPPVEIEHKLVGLGLPSTTLYSTDPLDPKPLEDRLKALKVVKKIRDQFMKEITDRPTGRQKLVKETRKTVEQADPVSAFEGIGGTTTEVIEASLAPVNTPIQKKALPEKKVPSVAKKQPPTQATFTPPTSKQPTFAPPKKVASRPKAPVKKAV